MAYIHHPVVGEPLFGGRPRLPRAASERLRAALTGFRRQALHARRLELRHPSSGQLLGWETDIPSDFAWLLTLLREES
jgi:23S rRNA pseudouridine1911/1915/1917 synthase